MSAAPRRKEGGMTTGLPAPDAEKDVVGPEAPMHTYGVVVRDHAVKRVDAGRGARHSAVGATIEPLEHLGVREKCGLDLSHALEIGEGSPRVLVEPGLSTCAAPPGPLEMVGVLGRQHDDRAAWAQAAETGHGVREERQQPLG